MCSMVGRLAKCLRGISARPASSYGLPGRGSWLCLSTSSFEEPEKNNEMKYDDLVDDKRDLEPQGVDPKKGWAFRGVHKAKFFTDHVVRVPILNEELISDKVQKRPTYPFMGRYLLRWFDLTSARSVWSFLETCFATQTKAKIFQ